MSIYLIEAKLAAALSEEWMSGCSLEAAQVASLV